MKNMRCVETAIEIREMVVQCRVGQYHAEREAEQTVVLNLSVTPVESTVLADDIAATIDYREVENNVRQLLEEQSCVSLECLTERVAQLCMDDLRVGFVRVEAAKPMKIPGCRAVGVIRSFSRPSGPAVRGLVLGCQDIEESKVFYGYLGFVFEEEHHPRGPMHYAAKREGFVLELYPLRNGGPEERAVDPRMIMVEVPDLAAVVALIPLQHQKGHHSSTVAQYVDPDGRSVRVTQA